MSLLLMLLFQKAVSLIQLSFFCSLMILKIAIYDDDTTLYSEAILKMKWSHKARLLSQLDLSQEPPDSQQQLGGIPSNWTTPSWYDHLLVEFLTLSKTPIKFGPLLNWFAKYILQSSMLWFLSHTVQLLIDLVICFVPLSSAFGR